MAKVRLELFSTIFDNQTIPDFYSSISYADNLIINEPNTCSINGSKVYSVNLVPSYMSCQLCDEHLFNSKKITQHNWGYAIFLNSDSNAAEYLKNKFNSNFRTNLNRSIRRLETCFNIKYKMYHGEIALHDYESLMESLRIMLVNRFRAINEPNNNLPKWKAISKETFPLINQKKASLFVIYHGNRPIEISLNYHLDKILFSSISSYDLDYSKFGLGHIEIYKQLEWCYSNNYIVFEMGVGGMDYKRRWSNNIYNYEHHIYYNKSFPTNSYGLFEIAKIRLKEYLKSKHIPLYIQKIKSAFSPSKDVVDKTTREVKIEQLNAKEIHGDLIRLNLESEGFDHLRKHVYDFMYSNPENIANVEIFQINGTNSYIIKGSDKQIKITL
ncbi:GNAT family N-acetyltransferase [Arenibacter troitsensis]|uniref:Acetyltransferase (GNAT) domain-containing protein n=1 Tax=Arenibacter troitsensis TaxID=188872 RepID=A0A1X7IZ09_9FLAO|nr:GNAT family N-acetyltransferase [Arenibacter troitsensis]SMG20513.1 Acetyltransferase (GNAT) domain-containing protein [Arenibacter troitsensis]